jgi:hypothetical protein
MQKSKQKKNHQRIIAAVMNVENNKIKQHKIVQIHDHLHLISTEKRKRPLTDFEANTRHTHTHTHTPVPNEQ